MQLIDKSMQFVYYTRLAPDLITLLCNFKHKK